ncbi:MAG: alkaline phosphatase family protein [Thermoplasmata archaeon]|nr:alkaline phosphatase family protein [Thermoplasmata archaeon]
MPGGGGTSATGRRLLIFGLDGVPPELLFDRLLPRMPNVQALVERGVRAPLRTTDPPISVPAWPVMFTGVDPGTLGLYGFRHRRPHSYTDMYLPASSDVPVPTIWQILSERGRRVAVVGMPLGFPPPAVNGVYVSDFLTPPGSEVTTFPPELRAELDRPGEPYLYDVAFRSGDLDRVAREIFEMTRRRFRAAERLYDLEPWDVFALHEIGTDRLHHAFWKHFDRTHPQFQPGNPYERVAEEYYALVDDGIGRLLERVGDRTDVVIVSDHGSMAMRGCICVNQWLEENGYLVLRHPPARPGTPLEECDVDWRRTTAWGAGGYYARLFLNVRGREPEGVVAPGQVDAVRAQLIEDLQRLCGPDEEPISVEVFQPERLYHAVAGDSPDLMVYFDGLRIRSAGTMGHPTGFLPENDTGPDDAVHGPYGVFLYAPAGGGEPRVLPEFPVVDVTPTLLRILGEPVPEHMQGRAVEAVAAGAAGLAPTPNAA